MQRDTDNWIASAEYDLETARHMFKSERYLYVVFMCHLALEKMLKAHVAEVTKMIPAKTHDLVYLVSKAQLKLSADQLDFVGKINNASIPTRYPDDLKKMVKDYSKDIAAAYLKKTAEVILWLKKKLS